LIPFQLIHELKTQVSPTIPNLVLSDIRGGSMSRISSSKTIWRLAALGLLLLSSLGPWFADTHPATAERCLAPLVYVGNGYCACLITLISLFTSAGNWVEWLGIPPLLPFLFTALYFLGGNHRFLWYFHLAGWFLIAIYTLFWFIIGWSAGQRLFLWGAGLCAAAAIALLAWEILTAKRQPELDLLPTQ
jgi:hypothetical protein